MIIHVGVENPPNPILDLSKETLQPTKLSSQRRTLYFRAAGDRRNVPTDSQDKIVDGKSDDDVIFILERPLAAYPTYYNKNIIIQHALAHTHPNARADVFSALPQTIAANNN
jgi:hypothetical protein